MVKLRCSYFLSCAILATLQGAASKRSHTRGLEHDSHSSDYRRDHGDTRQHHPSSMKAFQLQNGADSVKWTNWEEWSRCTKTCGFGISIRTRECVDKDGTKSSELEDTLDGSGGGCVGVYKEIQTCNTQLCPTGMPTSRESQCSEFNNKAFMGRQYQWEPFINPKGRCELTCRAKGFRFYARLAATVADGTPCIPGDDDVCISGLCKKVGCDGLVGSDAIMDVCGECKGDNSTCDIVSGTLTSDQLVQGYNTVLRVPAGATSINVTELRTSSNFLAVRTSPDTYILNGPRELASEGEYFAAGTKFTYKKHEENWCPGQCFSAKGPISQPIEIQILYYHRNPGIRYQYSIPKTAHRRSENTHFDQERHRTKDLRKAELAGYLSDSREVQHDERSHERSASRSHGRHDRRRHDGSQHRTASRSRQTFPFKKYTQSFTFGEKSVVNERYRLRNQDRSSRDHTIGSSSSLPVSRSAENVRRTKSSERSRARGHSRLDSRGRSSERPDFALRQSQTDPKRTDSDSRRHPYTSRHTTAQTVDQRNRQAHRRYHQTDQRRHIDLRHRQTDSRYHQTDSRYRQTNSQYHSTGTGHRQPDSRHRDVSLRHRQTDSRNRQAAPRYPLTDSRNRHTHVGGTDRRTHSMPPGTRHGGHRGHNSHRSLTDNYHQSAIDARRTEEQKRYNQNLNVQKQPVYLGQTVSPNRALSFTTPRNRHGLSNRLPSISLAQDNRGIRNNSAWSEQDIRDFNRALWRQNQVSDQEYSWKISGLTECSASCGGGYQETVIVCVKRSSQVTVTGENCEHARKPETQTVICKQQPCPAEWHVSSWGECSVTCDSGVQSRQVTCKRKISPTVNLTVQTGDCSALTRPTTTQRCAREKCFLWVVGNWTKCSAPCGKGERSREVVCQSLSGEAASEGQCTRREHKPLVTEVCDLGSCGVGWFYTQWPEQCSASCGEGKQERKIHCAGPRGDSLDASKCKQFHKPDTERTCKTNTPCGGKWFTGPWFKCNSTCGQGFQKRDVKCMKKLGSDFVTVVEDENCVIEEKPVSDRPCEHLPRCRPEWYIKDWDQCSASCGTGYQTREVKCLDERQVPSPDCLQTDKPVVRQSCNVHSCQRTHRPKDDSCKDTFYSCNLVVQARLCRYKYYQTACCDSCVESGQISRE